MPNRILIIGSDFSQEMPSGMMDRFSNVKMIVNKGKNSMSMEMVSQLLMIQSQYKIQIDLVQIDSKDREDFNMQFALRLGLLLSEDDVEITFLSDDSTFDHIFEVCKDLHLRVSRMSALGSDNGVSTAKEETPAPSFSRRRQPEPEPEPEPEPKPEPEPRPAPQPRRPAKPEPAPAPASGADRNRKLISSLLGGSKAL